MNVLHADDYMTLVLAMKKPEYVICIVPGIGKLRLVEYPVLWDGVSIINIWRFSAAITRDIELLVANYYYNGWLGKRIIIQQKLGYKMCKGGIINLQYSLRR